MTTALESAVEAVMAVVAQVDGVRSAPTEPPEQASVFPFVVGWPGEGTFSPGPMPSMTGLHTIVLELHVNRQSLSFDMARIKPLITAIPLAIYAALLAGTLTSSQTFASIRYNLAVMEYAGIKTLGYRFALEGLKTQEDVT